MPKVTPQPVSVDIDFTDAQFTGQGGLACHAQLARKTGLLEQIAQRIHLKQRQRGASDAEMLWSLVATRASGIGALSDLDALRQNGRLTPGQHLCGSALAQREVRMRLHEGLQSYGDFWCTGEGRKGGVSC